jgi:Fe2+ transport system protein FeoA
MKSIQCPLIDAVADKVYLIEELDLSEKSKEQLRRLGCAVGESFHVVSQCHKCTIITFDDVQFAVDEVLGRKIKVKESTK